MDKKDTASKHAHSLKLKSKIRRKVRSSWTINIVVGVVSPRLAVPLVI